MSTKTSKENNQSKKNECRGAMIICGLCEKPFCNGCFKNCPDCHSSQDLEEECVCGAIGEGSVCVFHAIGGGSKPVSEGKECKEWTEIMFGEPTIRDSHEWVEIENNARVQVLRCEKCRKISTAKHQSNE